MRFILEYPIYKLRPKYDYTLHSINTDTKLILIYFLSHYRYSIRCRFSYLKYITHCTGSTFVSNLSMLLLSHSMFVLYSILQLSHSVNNSMFPMQKISTGKW